MKQLLPLLCSTECNHMHNLCSEISDFQITVEARQKHQPSKNPKLNMKPIIVILWHSRQLKAPASATEITFPMKTGSPKTGEMADDRRLL